MRPGDFLLISDLDNSNLFDKNDPVAFCSLPRLPNTEGSIQLIRSDGLSIHSIEYSSDWHDYPKSEGGWALEMINSEDP